MIIAIGHLHSKGIVHRDLKLENILVDQTGYLKIIDYGLAKILHEDQLSYSFAGTPEYLAPETVDRSGHDKMVDWWAVGVLIYEMLIGVTPFFNRNRAILLEKIQNSRVVFPNRKKYKIEFTDEVMDLVLKLLDKNRATRLGAKYDAKEILAHPVFNDIDIEALTKLEAEPPFIPNFGFKELSDLSGFFNV